MQCNIDQRGRTLRVAAGMVVDGGGVLLVFLAALGIIEGTWPYIVGVAAMIGGSFMLFEGLRGWCVLRALGIRTPL